MKKVKAIACAQERFRISAQRIGFGEDGLLADPWPDWFTAVVLRFARLFAPDYKLGDFKNNRLKFDAHNAGVFFHLAKAAQEIDFSDWPSGPVWTEIKRKLIKDGKLEFKRVQQTIDAAQKLPRAEAEKFFESFGNAAAAPVTEDIMERLTEGVAVQICWFLIIHRWVIERREVSTVTELWKRFVGFKRLPEPNWGAGEDVVKKRGKDAGNSGAVLASWEQQFRKICSEDGIKLAPKGRPKKCTPGKGAKK